LHQQQLAAPQQQQQQQAVVSAVFSQFTLTPQEVLQELLGDLFIHESRLNTGEQSSAYRAITENQLIQQQWRQQQCSSPLLMLLVALHCVSTLHIVAVPHDAFPVLTACRHASRSNNRSMLLLLLLLLLPGDLLGQGGFADVHAAQLVDPLLGFRQAVAVKRLRPDVLKSPADLREFLTEANLLRKLAHRCAGCDTFCPIKGPRGWWSLDHTCAQARRCAAHAFCAHARKQ
jgi:hypothetical protein